MLFEVSLKLKTHDAKWIIKPSDCDIWTHFSDVQVKLDFVWALTWEQQNTKFQIHLSRNGVRSFPTTSL